ncbi:hypothetical protein [Paraburkholderia diazotrophica]|uniref:hypothetical protein n=1 Tax=Paraburkholderia diazotrophica TaxID=667676 RepID=UPI003D16D206
MTLQKELDEANRRADRRDMDHRRAVEALQAQLGDARHQAGVLQGRLDAVQATNVTLQQQLAARREADVRRAGPARPGRAKGAPAGTTAARPVATRPARPAGAARAASAPASKTAVRRKRGKSDDR